VDQVTLFIVRSLLEETACAQGLLGLVVGLSLLEEFFFLCVLQNQRCDRDRSEQFRLARFQIQLLMEDILLCSGVKGNHRESTGNQHIFGLSRLTLWAKLRNLTRYFHTGSTSSVGNLTTKFEITNFHEWVLDGDSVHGRSDGTDALAGMTVGNDTSKGIEIHKQ
jgi:hypothetical protein